MGIIYDLALTAEIRTCATCKHVDHCPGAQTKFWCPNWARRGEEHTHGTNGT